MKSHCLENLRFHQPLYKMQGYYYEGKSSKPLFGNHCIHKMQGYCYEGKSSKPFQSHCLENLHFHQYIKYKNPFTWILLGKSSKPLKPLLQIFTFPLIQPLYIYT